MIAGIKAWKLGKNVKIIERRVSYTREQIMGLDPNFQAWFKKDAPELFHKPVSDEFFTDGPFMRDLTSEEIKIRDFLLESGATRISFATHIKPLQDLGISSKNTTKLRKLARALQDNPFMNESAVISLFTK